MGQTPGMTLLAVCRSRFAAANPALGGRVRPRCQMPGQVRSSGRAWAVAKTARRAALLGAAAALLALVAAGPAGAEEAKPAAAPAAKTPAEDVVIKTLPGIIVDTKAKEVRLAGTVCLQKGPLELFVCSPGTREYESVIVVKAKPSHVTFALALLGLAPGRPGYMTEGGVFSPPAGAVLDIIARFSLEKTENGVKRTEVREVPAWRFLRPAGSDRPLDRPVEWVYVGQASDDALRAADREGTVICLSNFVEAVIDVPFQSTSVNADLLYQADFDTVPPKGTPVELIIRPTGRRIEPKRVEIEVVVKKGQPPILDGKPLEMAEFKNAVNGQPPDVRAAILRADPDEKFGRVMEIRDILRDALMQINLVVLKPASATPAAPAKPAAPPLEIRLTDDDKVGLGGKTVSVEEFRAKAGDLLRGVERVNLTVDARTSPKAVAEVMSAARDHGALVNLHRSQPGKE